MSLETPKQYNQEYSRNLIEAQGFQVTLVPHDEVPLIPYTSGVAMQCIDGRYGARTIGVFAPDSSIKDRVIRQRPADKEGPKFPGGTTGLAAVCNAADIIGMNTIAAKLQELGLATGTHGKCGFVQLLSERRLDALKFISQNLPDFDFYRQSQMSKGQLMRGLTRQHHGFHPTFEGLVHQEVALQFNPYDGVTTSSDLKYFKADLALPANHFGISPTRSILLTLEVVRQLAPHVRRVELLV